MFQLFLRQTSNNNVILSKLTSNQRDKFVVCTKSESQCFPVGEEGAVNREKEQPEKGEIRQFKKLRKKEKEKKATLLRRENRSPSL